MFRGDLLIDGYNLLHAAGLARRSYGPGEFERCRRRLLKLLANQLLEQERRRTTVVFDAPEQSLGPSPPKTMHDMRVIFADGTGDADTAIEGLIRQNSAPRRMHVVSSDHRIQRAARRRRARFYDSEAFLARIARRPTPEERAERTEQAEPKQKREGLTAASEIEAWLRDFSDVDPAAIDSSVIDSASTSGTSIPPTEKTRSPSTGPPKTAVPSSAVHPSPKKSRRRVASDELEFWEQRVAELWEDHDRHR